MSKAIFAAMVVAAALTAPGAAQAAVCTPNGEVCVADPEETVEFVVDTAEATGEEAEAAVEEAGVPEVLAAVTKQTRAVANAVLTPVENANEVCIPAPEPICVTGVGDNVVALEDAVCDQVPSPELERLVGWVTDRCFTGFP